MKTNGALDVTPLFPAASGFRQAAAQPEQGFADQLSGLARLLAADTGTIPEAQGLSREEASAEAALPPEVTESAATEDRVPLAEELAGHPDEEPADQHADQRESAESHEQEQTELADADNLPPEAWIAASAAIRESQPHAIPVLDGRRAPGMQPSSETSVTAAAVPGANRIPSQFDLSGIRTGVSAAAPNTASRFARTEGAERPAGFELDLGLRLEPGRGRELDPSLMRWLQANGSQAASVSASVEPGVATTGPALHTTAVRTHTPSEWAPIKLADQSTQHWGRDLAAALGDRLSMQVRQNVKEAHVRLDPPELGRIEMTVRLDGDRLNVQLHASQVQVRELLAQHAERLRLDLIEQHGHAVDVHVGSDTGRQDSRPAYPEQERIERGLTIAVDETSSTPLAHDSWLSTKA